MRQLNDPKVPNFGVDTGAGLPAETVAELHEIVARYPQPRSALLPMLHLTQSIEGCVTPTAIETVAGILGLETAEVTAVATFYTMFKRQVVGDYHVGVCTNTLCAVMGGDLIFERLKNHLGVENDETTPDGKFTLEHIECNAACDYAPVVMVNWEFFDNQTPDSAVQLLEDLRVGKQVQSTRGAHICRWRQAERVLAGFPDGLVDEGPAAGPATLVGLELARERGWAAPAPARPPTSSGPRSPSRARKEPAADGQDAAEAAGPKRPARRSTNRIAEALQDGETDATGGKRPRRPSKRRTGGDEEAGE
ncbi:MAG TPA: NADH-quinone oxidoreductase subunit NuoE [Nocardioidaceae bacterium]|nr:NADH-quinone oxidoreductase subunit NuoE [Nocardioidaceae bacterium]